jgi:carbonic anhydrase/acetyltransferase-like protein (isoleucine patch superfamily)
MSDGGIVTSNSVALGAEIGEYCLVVVPSAKVTNATTPESKALPASTTLTL